MANIHLTTIIIIAILLIVVSIAFFFLGDAAFFLLTEHHEADKRQLMSKVYTITACFCVIWFVTMFLIVLIATELTIPPVYQ